MIHITSLDDGVELFKALGSDVRIQILNILLENDHMSMNQLATQLNLSNGALTGHIKKLEECGLISTSNESAAHGNSKICSVIQDKIVIEIEKPIDLANVSTTDIKVGQFSKFDICPTCGLANSSSTAHLLLVKSMMQDTLLILIISMQILFGLQRDTLNTLYLISFLATIKSLRFPSPSRFHLRLQE